jgi:hypothetical protein
MSLEKSIEKMLRNFFEENKIQEFEEKLLLNENFVCNLKKFIYFGVLFACIVFTSIVIIGYYVGLEWNRFIAFGIVGFFISFFVLYIAEDVIFEKRKRKKEELLPNMLLEASVFCDNNSLLKTIEKISLQENSLIQKDFERALIEIHNGSSVDEALQRIKKLNKSKSYNRVIDLFLTSYKTGAKMSIVFLETAEDLMENKAIIKERQAVMLVTKYTLLLSASLIVPGILGLIIGLVGGMNFIGMDSIGMGLSIEARKEIFGLAVLGVNLYVIEYAIIGSLFLALQEGNKKQFWVYCFLLIPVSTIVFFIAQI